MLFTNLAYASEEYVPDSKSEALNDSYIVYKIGTGFYNPGALDGKSNDNIVNYGEVNFGYHFKTNIEIYLSGRYVNNEFNPGSKISYVLPVSSDNSIYFSGGMYGSEKYELLPNFSFGIEHKLGDTLDFYVDSTLQSTDVENQVLMGIGLKLSPEREMADKTEFEYVGSNLDVDPDVVEQIDESEVDTNDVYEEKNEYPQPEQPADQTEEVAQSADVEEIEVSDNAQPVKIASLQNCSFTYVVKQDDWIVKVADGLGISPSTLVELNLQYFNDIDIIEPGDLICIGR